MPLNIWKDGIYSVFFLFIQTTGGSCRDARTCVFLEYLRLLEICTAIYYKAHQKHVQSLTRTDVRLYGKQAQKRRRDCSRLLDILGNNPYFNLARHSLTLDSILALIESESSFFTNFSPVMFS